MSQTQALQPPLVVTVNSDLTATVESATSYVVPGAKNLVGATVNVPAGFYPNCAGGPVDPGSAAAFDAAVFAGTAGGVMARALQEVFLSKEGVFPTTLPTSWTQHVAKGGRLMISIKPKQDLSSGDAFSAFLTLCATRLGPKAFDIELWQEPNNGGKFPSGNAYKSYAAFYTPIIRKTAPGAKVIYNPTLAAPGDASNAQSVWDYAPDDCDMVLADWYCSSMLRGGKLEDIVGVADERNVQFGLGEWSVAASATPVTQDQFIAYTQHIIDFCEARIAAGKDMGYLVFWGTGDATSHDVVPVGDWKIPAIRRVYDRLAA